MFLLVATKAIYAKVVDEDTSRNTYIGAYMLAPTSLPLRRRSECQLGVGMSVKVVVDETTVLE